MDVVNSKLTTKWKATDVTNPIVFNNQTNKIGLNYDSDYFRLDTTTNRLQTYVRAVNSPLELFPDVGRISLKFDADYFTVDST